MIARPLRFPIPVGMVPILAALVGPAGGCKAELPDQIARDASIEPICTPYADQLVVFNPAGGEGGSELGNQALGAPDGMSVPIVENSVLSVAFVGLGGIVDDMGGADDLRVHGSLSPGTEIAVYVGAGQELIFSGNLVPDDMDIDISTASADVATFVRLVGLSGEGSIDAFESLQTNCNNSLAVGQD